MKTLHTVTAITLLTLGSTRSADAQVTITSNDLFAIGSHYQLGVDGSPSITPGNSGTNLTWNFGTLTAEDTRILEVMAPQDSPFGTQLAGNRAVVENTGEAAEYLTVNTAQLLSQGFVLGEGGVQVPLTLTPPMVLLNLPAQYDQNHGGVSRARITSYLGLDIGLGYVVDSIRFRTHIDYVSEVDSWGMVTTPLGSFSAIRQFLLQNVTDTMDVYRADQDLWIEGIDVTTNTERTWNWWTPEHDLPLVQLFDDDGISGVDRAEWIEADLNASGIEDHEAMNSVHVYPNPATDHVTVALEGYGLANYAIYDLSGKRVQEGRLTADRPNIPLMHLERGAYALRVEQGGSVRQARLLLQ